MKWLATGDLHLTDDLRDEYRWSFCARLPDIARKRNVERIVICGDLTEVKDNHGARLVNRMVKLIVALSDWCPVEIYMGNHDYANEGHPFFAFLSTLPNVTWIDKPETKLGCLFLPHTRNYKEDWKGIQFKGHDWVFAHNTFTGAQIGFGRGLEGIPLETFPSNIRVIAGDVHKPQRLGPVTYVGAPYTVDYGDDYKPRLLLLENKKTISIGVSSYPQKRLIEVADISQLDAFECNEGDILKVRIEVDDLEGWKKKHDWVLGWAASSGFIAQRIEPVLLHKRKVKRHKVVSSKADDMELLDQYGKRHALTANTLNVGKALIDEPGN